MAERNPRLDPKPGDRFRRSWRLPLSNKETGVSVRVIEIGERVQLDILEGWVFNCCPTAKAFLDWVKDAEVLHAAE